MKETNQVPHDLLKKDCKTTKQKLIREIKRYTRQKNYEVFNTIQRLSKEKIDGWKFGLLKESFDLRKQQDLSEQQIDPNQGGKNNELENLEGPKKMP